MKKPRYPQVSISTYGRTGTDIATDVANAIRAVGATQDEINDYYMQARRGSREDTITVSREWVKLRAMG
jgi:hypothetical protein